MGEFPFSSDDSESLSDHRLPLVVMEGWGTGGLWRGLEKVQCPLATQAFCCH